MDELVGQRLGDYRLSALVSRSAFVETYQGTHVRTGANAAIKVFPTRLSGDGIDIFQREAQRLAELAHPHLVRVFDFDISGGLAFLALDALPDSLRRRYPVGTRVPVAQVIAYIGQLGGALQYGHDQGLLHGDMRPEHLLTRPGDSQVMLSDLGIAEIVRVISLANNNPVKAAGPYAAPELAGEAPSAASDQYALAVIAYEWLTGELPFPDASSVDFARQRLLDTLKGKVPALSADTGDVLITALDRVPEQRFGRVQAFATALALASGLPSQTTAQAQSAPTVLTPPTLATPTPPTVAPTAQAVTLASSPLPTQPSSPHLAAVQPTLPPYQAPAPVAPLASPYQAPSSAQPYPAAPLPYQAPAPYQLYPGAPAGPAAPSVAPTPAVSRRQLLAGLIAGAAGLIVIGVTDGIVFARMNASVAASVQPASPTLVYTHHTQNKDAEMGQIIWSADSSRIAVVPTLSLNSQIEFWDATTGQHSGAWSIPSSEDRIAASWSGDKLLVIVPDKNSKDVAIVDAASNQKIVAYTGYEKNDVLFVLNAHWSQDGKRVGSVSGFVDIWDAASGQNIISIGPKLVNNADGSGMVYSEAINNNAGQSDFAWSPDDKRIVSSSESGILRVWDTQSGQQIASYTKHWQEHAAHANLGYVSIGWMSWSPNGLFIASQGEASSGTDSTIHVWSAIDGSQVSLYKGHEGQGVNALVWSPDSSTIASVGRDGLIHVWNPMTAAKIYIRTDTASTGLAWSPKGGRIASTGAQSESTIAFQIWNATDGSQVVNYTATLSGDSYSIGSATLIAWSPDEQLIATVSEDGTTRIWKGGQ